MEQQGWDSPRKTRAFLAAALAIAVGGTLYESRVAAPDVPSWDAPPAGASVPASGPAPFVEETTAPSASAAQNDAGSAAGTVAAAGAASPENLRDAVASPGWQGSMAPAAAARSAAFSTAGGGRVPGAYAPAGAGDARSALGALSGGARGEDSAAKARTAAALAGSGAKPAEPEDAGAPSGRAPVVSAAAAARGRAAGVTPAERFFSGADLSGAVSVSSRELGDAPPSAVERVTGERAARARARRLKRLRPALLSRMLGRRALKAPKDAPAPKARPWTRGVPREAVNASPLPYADAEDVGAPPACDRAGAHWHADGEVSWLHDGKTWGRSAPEGWAWLSKEGSRLWLWPDPQQPPLLRQEEHWWLRSRGLWFLLHDGAPWGERYLQEWGAEGFVHPSGAQMIYSADGARVGMVEPDAGAVLYDAETGAELGRWPPSALPQKRVPRVPKTLAAPR